MMNVASLFENVVRDRLRARAELCGRRDEVCKFRITGRGGGTWVIDFAGDEAEVRAADEDAHCVITVSCEDLESVVHGAVDPRALFLSGRLKVAGYLDLAIKMAKALSS